MTHRTTGTVARDLLRRAAALRARMNDQRASRRKSSDAARPVPLVRIGGRWWNRDQIFEEAAEEAAGEP